MTTDSVTHNFQERLKFSADLSDEPSWVEFYRRLWPEMITCVRLDKLSKWQLAGIDREIVLPGFYDDRFFGHERPP